MDYKLTEVAGKIQGFADKMGSDYFTVPDILDHFETATYKFIGEKLRHVEKTQEVTDDLSSLVLRSKVIVSEDPNEPGKYIAALPTKYLRLLGYDVLYSDGSRCRRADMIRHSEYAINQNNPNKRPTKHYPIIMMANNGFQIDAGEDVPAHMLLTYCKKPEFAKTNEGDKRIVNMSDEAIENIILSTVTSLFGRTGDQRVQTNHQLEEAFRKFTR